MREKSYGQHEKHTILDKLGVYLSIRRINKELKVVFSNNGSRSVLDLGAGYNMKIISRLQTKFNKLIAVDVALNKSIYPNIEKIEETIENSIFSLTSDSFDAVILNSVIEHLDNPLIVLKECRRMLKQNGLLLINVPTWTGKFFLEFTAFTLKMPASRYEMNDHKMYYDIKDIWPLLVKAGFLPENIKLAYHKFGLNMFCRCTK
jgi:SAM-dependent methyltransferase